MSTRYSASCTFALAIETVEARGSADAALDAAGEEACSK
jgi:hypothetical protein